MRKIGIIVFTSLVISLTFSISAFAGNWIQDSIGWWWQYNDGSYIANSYAWIDGNKDGIAERYYFDNNGYCVMNTTTPDGSQVNEDGAWIVNGVEQIGEYAYFDGEPTLYDAIQEEEEKHRNISRFIRGY